MPGMAGPSAGAAKIQIPRWIQLVGLPLVLLLLWTVAGAARHVVFLFLIAGLIAFLLNPLVRGLTRVWIPRGFGVALVYLSFAAIILAAGIALGTVVVDQTKSSANRVNDYFTVGHGQAHTTHADRDVDLLQHWLDTHRLGGIKIRKQGHDFVDRVRAKDVSKYTGKVINFVEGAAIGTIKFLFSLVLVVVVSIYMLLDMPRLARAVDRRFPPHPDSPPLLTRIERSLASYVRGQVLLSLIIGTSAGTGLWLLGTLGVAPGAVDRHRVFYRTKTGTFSVSKPINGEPACAANGGTIGFLAKSQEEADAWHAAGIANGATTCEEPPGIREGGVKLTALIFPQLFSSPAK